MPYESCVVLLILQIIHLLFEAAMRRKTEGGNNVNDSYVKRAKHMTRMEIKITFY